MRQLIAARSQSPWHQYSQSSLEPKQLKGPDRTRAEVLVRAARSLDYQCYLALLTHEQSGEVDYDSWGSHQYHSRHSYGWSDYDEDEENDLDDRDESSVDMGEIYEEQRTLDHWLDPDGRKQSFGEMHLEESEILRPEETYHLPVKREIREATGNEGVSMDLWYRHGVVVIWPRDRFFAILASEGQASAIPALKQKAASSKTAPALAACRTFAAEIIDHWQPQQWIAGNADFHASAEMLTLLERIGTPELAERFLKDVLPKGCDGSEGKALVQVVRAIRLGTVRRRPLRFPCAAEPGRLFHATRPLRVDLRRAFLRIHRHSRKNDARCCASLVDPLAKVIDSLGRQATRTLGSTIDD